MIVFTLYLNLIFLIFKSLLGDFLIGKVLFSWVRIFNCYEFSLTTSRIIIFSSHRYNICFESFTSLTRDFNRSLLFPSREFQ